MKLGEVKELKRGAPTPKGLEVKAVSFDVQPAGDTAPSTFAALKGLVFAWLQSEVKLQTNKLIQTDNFKASFLNGEGKVAASLTLENYEISGMAAFELQSIVPFYRGVETTRVRALVDANSIRLEVSTFMESKDPTRAVHEIPRLADSLVSEFLDSEKFQFSVEGTVARNKPIRVTKENVKKSPLAQSHKQHVLPIIGFPDDEVGNQQAVRLAAEAAGLAEVLVVAKDLFGKSDRSFFVYWRDGSSGVEWHQTIASKYRVSRQVYLRGLRSEVFQTSWRQLQNAKRAVDAKLTKSAETQPVDRALVADLESQIQEWKNRTARITAERDSFIEEFDATQKRWNEWIAEGQKRNAKLFARSAKESIDPEEFQLNPVLAGDGSTLAEMFASLEAATQGAVVFTDRVTQSWREADKRGYGKPEPLERALERLCRLAIGYRLSKAELGGSRKQYFQSFGLELIEADNKLPNKKFMWEGKLYNQEHHIRADQKNATFNTLGRIHFDFDVDQLRIIVNHVGGKQYENDK